MRHKKIKLIFTFVIILAVVFVLVKTAKRNNSGEEIAKEITAHIGSIQSSISSTGTVLPRNRLEVKPPVNGRIESILVKEGDKVKAGRVLAMMSSTERAALLDAARGKSEEDLKYWQEVYKPIPLLSPIEGEVIVATTQPGQTVTTADAVIVLSDRLIVRAQVDETDIGKVTPGKEAVIAIDAYPDTKIKAYVGHIYYESKTVNNVTIYEVDLTPEEVPTFFRSGMNASIDFIEESKENSLILPVEAVHKEKDVSYVLVKQDKGIELLKVKVTLGISDDKNVEILSGLTENDLVIVKTKKYALPKSASGTNPFFPSRRR